MPLIREPELLVIDTVGTDVLTIAAGVITVKGYGEFLTADVTSCYRDCDTACTQQVTTVTVVIPTSCECPYEWSLRLVKKPCLWLYDTPQTFGKDSLYTYVDPSGADPVAATVAAAIVGYINADAYAFVTATVSGDDIILTEKNCDTGSYISCGFDAYTVSGTVVTSVDHADAIMNADAVNRMVPIRHGSFGSTPDLARCGSYCGYKLHINAANARRDIDMDNTPTAFIQEVLFLVNQDDTDFAANWDTPLSTELDCLTALPP